MTAAAGSIAHPRTIDVPVMGGERRLLVRPWVMAQRHELRPRLEALITRYVAWQEKPEAFDLAVLLSEFEDECAAIAEITVRGQLGEIGIAWDDLHYEDLPSIVQAIWETSIIRPGGGGLAGKLISVLGPAMLAVIRGAAAARPSSESSETSPTKTTSSEPSYAGSPSSPDAGEATPNASAGA